MLFETTAEERAHVKYTAEDRIQAYLANAEIDVESERAVTRMFSVRMGPIAGESIAFVHMNRWLWFSRGVLSRYVTYCIKADYPFQHGQFKDAAAAWMGLDETTQARLGHELWRKNALSRHFRECEAADKRVACYNIARAADNGQLRPRVDQALLAIALRECDWRERIIADGDAAARVVQRCYRLWMWRVRVLWNPNTEVGQQWMAVKAVGFARLAAQQ